MKRIIVSVFLLILVTELRPQNVYIPVNDDIYDFLDRMSVKGVSDFSKLVLPKTRQEIIGYLNDLYTKKTKLSPVEQDELDWYLSEFIAPPTSPFSDNAENDTLDSRWNLYSYQDTDFTFVLNPVLGADISSYYGESRVLSWGGISFYSYMGNWGAQMDFRDNTERSNLLDEDKQYTSATGIHITGRGDNSIEYSEVKGAVTFSNEYVNVIAGKEWFNWGSGYRGKLILSEKAPSFPFIRLDIKPVDWLRFYYIHGWLNSRVPDSSEFYDTQIEKWDSTAQQRLIDRKKFYAAHILEVTPFDDLRISLGESIVYSDDFQFGYLVPFLFFRLVDHYYEGTDGFGKGGNSQFFLDINYNIIPQLKLYSTVFVDELSLKGLLKGENDRNHIGYTIGFRNYGTINNLTFGFEYTKILPWVYSNFIQTQTYRNSGYLLGHYIGQNADQFFLEANYRFARGVELGAWGEYIRRGSMGDVNNQYYLPGEDFLYGSIRNDFNWGINFRYEYMHDLTAEIYYESTDVTDEDPVRTPAWQLGTNSRFGVLIKYGL